MNKLALLVFSVFFVLSCNKKEVQVNLLSPGISLDLARYRKQQVANVVYNLSFKIPQNKSEPIAAQLDLDLQIKNIEQPLYLDFNEESSHLKSVLVNDTQITINHQKEHVIIDSKDLTIGANVVTILFDAGELSLYRNDDYLYTLLVPDRASTLIPCFDQPDIKGHYVLDITAPKDCEVLCGSNIELKEAEGDIVRHKF